VPPLGNGHRNTPVAASSAAYFFEVGFFQICGCAEMDSVRRTVMSARRRLQTRSTTTTTSPASSNPSITRSKIGLRWIVSLTPLVAG
jgi:hypothetical protein